MDGSLGSFVYSKAMSALTFNDYELAVSRLRAGQLVAFPTETVYGLGGDALNPSALKAIFSLKGRPADHPLIAHVGSIEEALSLVSECSPSALDLMRQCWPGPLTLVLPKADHVPLELTGGQSSVAVRMPRHPVALELLRRFQKPLAAPSANRYGRISPTSSAHVRADFEGEDLLVLDGGECAIGIESTIVSLVGEPLLLRPGHYSEQYLQSIIGDLRCANQTEGPKASGRHISHYAPVTPARLVTDLEGIHPEEGVLAFEAKPPGHQGLWIEAATDPIEYAHHLYGWLRALDHAGAPQISIVDVPTTSLWVAIRDRLTRATAQ